MLNAARRNNARSIAAIVFGAAMIGTNVPIARADDAARDYTLNAATVIPVRLEDRLSSSDSHEGDPFTAVVQRYDPHHAGDAPTYANFAALPIGTHIEGVIREAKPKEGREPGVLDLEFRTVRLPDGATYPIEGSLIGLDNKSVIRTPDGRLIAKPDHTNNRLTYIGIGAGAGLVVGAFAKRPIEGTIIGGSIGALIGSLEHHSSTRDVVLKPGTELGMRLDRRMTFAYAGDDFNPGFREARFHRDHGDKDGDYDHPYPGDEPREVRHDGDGGPIGVLIGDKNVRFEPSAAPVMTGDGVMVPIFPILRAYDVEMRFDPREGVVRAKGADGWVRASVGSEVLFIDDGRRVRLEGQVRRMNGTVYAPIRYFRYAIGGSVSYDAGSRTVVIAPSGR